MNNLTNDLKKLAQEILNTDDLNAQSFKFIKTKAAEIYDQATIGIFLAENIDKIQKKRTTIEPTFAPAPPTPKAETVQKTTAPITNSFKETPPEFIKKTDTKKTIIKDTGSEKPKVSSIKSLNDIVHGQFNLSLNDRIIFTKHLFKNSSAALDKTIEKLSTLKTLKEANEYINTVIKPQFNDWEDKEETELRFVDWIEQNFNN